MQLELTYSGKNTFTISVDGIPFSKRFSGNWDGQQHFNYIRQEKKTAEEAIDYLSGKNFFSSLYSVEMDSYRPFLKKEIFETCFSIENNMFLKIKGSYEVDTEDFSEQDWEDFSCEEESYLENGILHKCTYSGSCDGSYYFDTESIYPIKENNELYIETEDGTLFFKGLSFKEDYKSLYKASKSFLEDFALTDEFKNKILIAWN